MLKTPHVCCTYTALTQLIHLNTVTNITKQENNDLINIEMDGRPEKTIITYFDFLPKMLLQSTETEYYPISCYRYKYFN